jgi:aromatic-L-amino-acid/L-tryptophan decarboxylase
MRPEQLMLSDRQMRDLGERLLNFIIAWHQGARHASVLRAFRVLGIPPANVRVLPSDAFRAAIARGIEIAEHAEQRIKRSRTLEIVTPAELGIVTFRAEGQGTDSLMRICTALRESGLAMLSTTRLRGETVLRMCTINPRTTDQDIDETISRIERLAAG